jgi:putative transposase
MRKSRFTEEQIIGALKEHSLSAGELCRKHDISDATFYSGDVSRLLAHIWIVGSPGCV